MNETLIDKDRKGKTIDSKNRKPVNTCSLKNMIKSHKLIYWRVF